MAKKRRDCMALYNLAHRKLQLLNNTHGFSMHVNRKAFFVALIKIKHVKCYNRILLEYPPHRAHETTNQKIAPVPEFYYVVKNVSRG